MCRFISVTAFGDACLKDGRNGTRALLFSNTYNKPPIMHIGSKLREQLKLDGKSVVWLARELGCHRTNIYNLFDKYSIDTQLLARISIIMNYNFFNLYKEEVDEKIQSL